MSMAIIAQGNMTRQPLPLRMNHLVFKPLYRSDGIVSWGLFKLDFVWWSQYSINGLPLRMNIA